jgi:hypothetical protein
VPFLSWVFIAFQNIFDTLPGTVLCMVSSRNKALPNVMAAL